MALDLIEPQYLALCVFAGFFGLSAVLYAIASFGMREKTYEEALAEQRARNEKENQQQQQVRKDRRREFTHRRKKDKEKPGKSPRQEKVRQGAVQPEEAGDERLYSEEDAPPTPPESVTPRQEKSKKKAKVVPKTSPQREKKQVEPEVIKKVNQPRVESVPPPVVEEIVQRVVVKPVQTKPVQTKPVQAKPVQAKPVPAKPVPAKPVQAKPVQAQSQEQLQATPPPRHQEDKVTPVKSKKSNKPIGASGDAPVDAQMKGTALVDAVKNAQLNPGEIQQMTEVLLSKQGGGSADDWVMANQRTDPTSVLKKQLQDKEQALHSEMLLSQSNQQKVKELKAELSQEKSRTLGLEGQYKGRLTHQSQELDALRRRMQQSHDSHSMETQDLQSRLKQMQTVIDENSGESIQKVQDENRRLKTESQQKEQIMGSEMGRLQSELQKLQTKLNTNEASLRQANDMRLEYESQIAKQNQQLSQSEASTMENSLSLSKRLTDMTEGHRKSETQRQSLKEDLERVQERNRVSSQELEQTKNRMQELYKNDEEKKQLIVKLEEKDQVAEYERQGLETRVRSAESQLKDGEDVKLGMVQQIQELKMEKQNLEGQLAVKEQRSEAEGQEEPTETATNGEINMKDSIAITEHESMLNQVQDASDKLQQQLNARVAEIQQLNDEIEKQREKNNNLRTKNWKAMNALSEAEKSSEERLGRSLSDLQNELSQKLLDEQQQSKAFVQRIFPAIEIDKSLAHKDWLNDFERQAAVLQASLATKNEEHEELHSKISSLEEDCENLTSDLESVEKEKEELSHEVSELEYEKKHLSAQCEHYQGVLENTEGMLNKLQSSVESEEQKWEDKLNSTEQLLQQDISDYDIIVSDLANSKSTIEQQEKERMVVATELDDVKTQLTQLKNELEAANQRAESSNVVEELKTKVANATSDLDAANKVVVDLKNQLQSLSGASVEVENLKKELQDGRELLERTQNQNQSSNESLQKELEQAKKTLEGQAQRADEDSQKSARLEGEVTRVKGDLEKVTSELDKAKSLSDDFQKTAATDLEAKSKEVETLNAAIEKEKKLTKDLGMAAGKLQQMLKATKGFLDTEKKTTATLRAEMGKKTEAEVDSSLTDSQVEEELAEALQESIKLATEAAAADQKIGGTSV